MRVHSALLFLVGTLLTAGGYGATFLLSMRFRMIGGSDLDTGAALAAATVGTFAGLSVVGWFSRQIGAARIAALSSLCIGAGIVGFALVGRGTFGFPSVGGWVMVHAGKGTLLMLIASCGLAALSLAFLHDRPAAARMQ